MLLGGSIWNLLNLSASQVAPTLLRLVGGWCSSHHSREEAFGSPCFAWNMGSHGRLPQWHSSIEPYGITQYRAALWVSPKGAACSLAHCPPPVILPTPRAFLGTAGPEESAGSSSTTSRKVPGAGRTSLPRSLPLHCAVKKGFRGGSFPPPEPLSAWLIGHIGSDCGDVITALQLLLGDGRPTAITQGSTLVGYTTCLSSNERARPCSNAQCP